MNEIYKLLQNVQEIARANNLFLQTFEARMQTLEASIKAMEGSLVLNIESDSEPQTAGAETTEQ